jgi:hypothetical protein
VADALSSIWDGLNDHLIASFYEVDRTGKRVNPDLTVRAPLTDASLDITQNWQSPFENVGQSNLPTLQQLLQSGTGASLAEKADGKLGTEIKKLVSSVEGKSSVTKLNSMQVWSGSPPAKIQITAVFRAWKDSEREVEAPVNQLMQWALPAHLESDSLFLSRLADTGASTDTVLPSTVPSILAFKYKNRTYSPLVIEAIGVPIASPINADGQYAELSVQITLATLTSIDRNDWIDYAKK